MRSGKVYLLDEPKDLNKIEVRKNSPNASKNVIVFSPKIDGINQFQRIITGNAITSPRTAAIISPRTPTTKPAKIFSMILI